MYQIKFLGFHTKNMFPSFCFLSRLSTEDTWLPTTIDGYYYFKHKCDQHTTKEAAVGTNNILAQPLISSVLAPRLVALNYPFLYPNHSSLSATLPDFLKPMFVTLSIKPKVILGNYIFTILPPLTHLALSPPVKIS